MVSRTDIEIKIERKLTPNVKENIFVTKPGTGRNHCLMGIHQVGKSTLVSDWGADWEETDGANAFAKAGSLCHGWSAMPVYYFHRLEEHL